MKIRFEHNGVAFEYTSAPLTERRFRAICALAAAGLYVRLALGMTELCGVTGLSAVAVVTVVGMLVATI